MLRAASVGALLITPTAGKVVGQTSGQPQIVFIGDRTCADLPTDCSFSVVPNTPYLHVIVHDVADNADWQVQSAPQCGGETTTIAGGVSTRTTGFLEEVVPLTQPGSIRCLVFRGRNHWAVTFYAAYIDDTPAPDAVIYFPHYRDVQGRPDLPDVDVLYIHRSPSYPYDAIPNSPAPGERVQFTAHVANSGVEAAAPFAYQWVLDGRTVAWGSSEVPLAPQQETEISWQWRWRPGHHRLALVTFPQDHEASQRNDRLEIRTDAITLGLWVEQGALAYFQKNQYHFCEFYSCSTSDSFADWLERQVAAWNHILALARYPDSAPGGVLDRVRVDEIVPVPDGSLPLHGDHASTEPDIHDHSVDLEWGMPALNIARAYRQNTDTSFDVDWSLIHELNHARSMADYYRFDVPARDASDIRVTDSHSDPIVGSENKVGEGSALHVIETQDKQQFFYQNREQDLMSCPCAHFYSAYSALVWNRLQGKRARCGNFNPPCNIGDWYLDLPPKILLRLAPGSAGGSPRNSSIVLYRDIGTGYSDHAFDNAHRSVLRRQGDLFVMPPDPFANHGSAWTAAHNLLLLEARTNGEDMFCFLEPTMVTVAFWQGYRTANRPANFTVQREPDSGNGCMLTRPRALVPEPFAISIDHSVVQRGATEGRLRPYTVTLSDGTPRGGRLRNRVIELMNRHGVVVAAGTTGRTGRVTIQVPAGVTVAAAIDVTDNDLSLRLAPTVSPPAKGQPRL